MDNRTRELRNYPTTTENQAIYVSVYYSKGGVNYFSGTSDARGYYLRVAPETRSNGSRSFTLFSGLKKFLKPAARFSQRELDALVVDEFVIVNVVQAVLSQEKLTLAPQTTYTPEGTGVVRLLRTPVTVAN